MSAQTPSSATPAPLRRAAGQTISGDTRVFGILGYPVNHTLSPVMYNALFEQLGLNAAYIAMEVHPDQLPQALQGLKALGVRGVHLTCPHKEEVLPYLDDLSEDARTVGAVNVVANRDGFLYGDNTDGPGFVVSVLEETPYQIPGSTVGVIGAGGAARAIAGALARQGASRIVFFNRTLSRAVQASDELGRVFPDTFFQALPLTGQAFQTWSPEFDLIVNAARGAASGLLDTFSLERVRPSCIISDINYYATRSPFLGQATSRRLLVHQGVGMLVHQGAISLKLLLGLDVDAEILRSFLQRG